MLMTPLKKTNSNITDFTKKPIVIILTVLTALLGGIPVIITTINYFNQKPELKFSLGTTQDATMIYPNGQKIGFFFITCSVVNIGTKPLFPAQFHVFVKYNDKETELNPSLVPADFHGHTDDSIHFKYKNSSENDLLKVKKISPDEVNYGNLFFVTTEDVVKEYQKTKNRFIKINCVDVFGKTYSSGFISYDHIITGDYIDPKTGFEAHPNTNP